jgi:catechol 2,3-dioxygenase-like lactoylglutathione lyase family enzyme
MEKLLIDQQITFIYVKDLELSRVFYEEIMGFPLALDQGKCRIVKTSKGGGGYLGYCLGNKISREPEGLILTFVTKDVDDWHRYLQNQYEGDIGQPKTNPDFGIYHFFLKDPDGYKLEIQYFLDPDWESTTRE